MLYNIFDCPKTAAATPATDQSLLLRRLVKPKIASSHTRVMSPFSSTYFVNTHHVPSFTSIYKF